MKNKKKEYQDHIKESWSFAKETTEKSLEVKGYASTSVALAIFEKCVSPYHYYLKNINSGSEDEKPTEKQLSYAKNLGIDNLESYTKKTLSAKIDKVKKDG